MGLFDVEVLRGGRSTEPKMEQSAKHTPTSLRPQGRLPDCAAQTFPTVMARGEYRLIRRPT